MTSTAHAALGRTIVHFDEPYFVTPHAIRRYRERVGRGSDMDIVRRINEGLQRAGPDYPTRRPVAIGDRRQRFVAIVEPPSPEYGEWPQVVSVWAWHLCPILLRRKGGPVKGWRRYRYLDPGSPELAPGHARQEPARSLRVLLWRVGRNLARAYRTAEAFGAGALELLECAGAVHGPLYSSRGRLDVIRLDEWPELSSAVLLEPQYPTDIRSVDWSRVDRVVLAGESATLPAGLAAGWRCRIPMYGGARQLTVEAALAIALYEWRRSS